MTHGSLLLLVLMGACMTSEQATRFERAERKLEALERRKVTTPEEQQQVQQEVAAVREEIEASKPSTPPWLIDGLNFVGSLALLYFTGRTGHRIYRKKRLKRGSPEP